MEENFKVLVKTNADGYITEVQSSGFYAVDGYTVIDEGTGDRYYHAQHHFFEKPLKDENGDYRYLLSEVLEQIAAEKAEMAEKARLAEAARLAAEEAERAALEAEIAEESEETAE